MATLELAQNQQQTTTRIAVTNGYQTAVTVAFTVGFSHAAGLAKSSLSAQQLAGIVHVQQPLVTLAPNQTVTQIITLQDSPALPPGSTPLAVTITQQPGSSQGVSVVPSLQVPLVLLKDAGATSHVTLQQVALPRAGLVIPASAAVRLKNEGNTIAIPRGSITIRDPRGRDVAAGIINESSLAVLPGNSLEISTKLVPLARAVLPGRYTAEVSYRPLSGQPAAITHTSLWYVAWWHVVLVLAGGAALYVGTRRAVGRFRKRPTGGPSSTTPPAKKQRLIGRDIT
jgi:hypothetical protein